MADLNFQMMNARKGPPERARGNLAPHPAEHSGLEPIEGLDSVSDVVKEVDQMPATSHGYDEKDIAKGFAFGPGYDGGGEIPEPDIEGIDSGDINEAAYEEGLYDDEMGDIPHMHMGSKAKKAKKAPGVRKTATIKKNQKKKQKKKQKKASFSKKKDKAKAKTKARAKKSLMKARKNLEKAFKEYNRVMKM